MSNIFSYVLKMDNFELDIPSVSSKWTYGSYHPTRNRENITQAIKPHEVGTTGSIQTVKKDVAPVNKKVLREMNQRVKPDQSTVWRNFPYNERTEFLRQSERRVISYGPRRANEVATTKKTKPSRQTCENVAPLDEPRRLLD